MIFVLLACVKYNIQVPKIAEPCHNECENLFNDHWLRPCTALIDARNFIADCKLDFCVADDVSKEQVKMDLLGSFINQCKAKLPPNNSVVCNWLSYASIMPSCGKNEVYKACALECSDFRSCNDLYDQQNRCQANQEKIGTCICRQGYYLHNGECVPERTCQAAFYTGRPGPWGAWGACSVTCGNGQKTRVRSCDGNGPCMPNVVYKKIDSCNMGACCKY